MINNYDYLRFYKPRGYPVRHRHKGPFNPSIEVDPNFISRAKAIRDYDREFDRFILAAGAYEELIIDSYATNIHWSTQLEGNPLSDGEVKRLTRATFSGQLEEKRAGPQQEIVNHLMNLIAPQRFELPWTIEKVCNLNHFLMKDTGSSCKTGEFRAAHACVKTDTGQEIFIPAPPNMVTNEIQELLNWANGKALALDQIIAAVIMFHEFESIHPFEDGNGRTGRCLFHLYLENRALSNSHLCKIDFHLLKDKDLYYDLLAYADDAGSYRELIDFVSIAILNGYEEANNYLSSKDLMTSGLDEASRRLLVKARTLKDYFSVSQASDWVDGLTEQSIRNKLNDLVDLDVLESKGATRARRYRFKDPLSSMRERLPMNERTDVREASITQSKLNSERP